MTNNNETISSGDARFVIDGAQRLGDDAGATESNKGLGYFLTEALNCHSLFPASRSPNWLPARYSGLT